MGCCGGAITEEERERRKFQEIASRLPLSKGTIIREDGTLVDIADLVGVEKTPMDPQLARSQNIFPYYRDLMIMKDGKTCSLVDVLSALFEVRVTTTDLTRLQRIQMTEEDWSKWR